MTNPHYVVPVFEGGPVNQLGTVYDLVAFRPSQPDRWKLRFGVATLLGPDWPEWCGLHEEPLQLYSNPLGWLRAGGRGSCVVDWSAHLPLHLGGVQNIVCDTPELASRLYTALNKERSAPVIHISTRGLNDAAA